MKQEKFAIKYIECNNLTEAYYYAYDTDNMTHGTVSACGSKLLTNPLVAARVLDLRLETARELLVSEKSVLREYTRIGFSDVRKLFNEDGDLIPIHDIDVETAAAISSIKFSTRSTGRGRDKVENVIEVKLWSKMSALDNLARRLGFFNKNGDSTADVLAKAMKNYVEELPD